MVKSVFFKNTSLLMISNIVSGILALAFSIILSREIGPRGVGLFQLIMPLYTMLIYLTGGGISVAMSRVAAEKKANGRLMEIYDTLKIVCILEVIWAVFIVGIIMLCAGFISRSILSDSRTYYCILAFCPALMLTALSSTFRGTYYGVQRVAVPATIEIIEKLSKIIFMYFMVLVLKNISLELAAGAAVLSLSCGEFISFLLFFLSYRKYRNSNPGFGKSDNKLQLAFNTFKIAIPISMEGVLTAVFSTIVAILIPRRLQHAGIGYEEALSLLGKLQGMAMNIAFFPMLITSAFNVLLIPSIAELVASKNKRLLMHRINSAIGLASFTACLTASILLSAPIKLGGFFYNDYTVGVILKVIAPVLPLIYLELLSYAIINGLGLQIKLLINSIVVQSLDLILLYIFVGDSRFKIYGYAINISISSLLGIMVNYRLIIKNTQLKINWALIVVIPFLCGIATYIIASNIIFIYCDVPIAIVITSIFYFGLYISSNKLLHNSSIIVKNLF